MSPCHPSVSYWCSCIKGVVRNRKSKKDGQYKEQDEQTNNGQQNTKIKPNIDNTNPPKNWVETPGTRGKDSSPSFLLKLRTNCTISFNFYFQFNNKLIWYYISSKNNHFYTKQLIEENPSSIYIHL